MASIYNNTSDNYNEEMEDHGRKDSQEQLSKANGASKIHTAGFEAKFGGDYGGISKHKKTKKHAVLQQGIFKERLGECFGTLYVFNGGQNAFVSPVEITLEEFQEHYKEVEKELTKKESPGDLRKAFKGEQQRTEDILTIGQHVAMKTMAEVEQMDEEDMDVAISVFEGTSEKAGGASKRAQTLRHTGKAMVNLARAYNS